MENKKKERNRVDKNRSKYKKKRKGFHGYKPENVTTTTTQIDAHQDGEEPDLSLSDVGKTEKEFVVGDVENLKTIYQTVPIAVNSNSSQGPSISNVVSRKMKRQCFRKYHDKFASTRL